jgi:hypothetical protein
LLAEPFWGQGIIIKAIKHVVDFAFKNYNIDRNLSVLLEQKLLTTSIGKEWFCSGWKFEKILEKMEDY